MFNHRVDDHVRSDHLMVIVNKMTCLQNDQERLSAICLSTVLHCSGLAWISQGNGFSTGEAPVVGQETVSYEDYRLASPMSYSDVDPANRIEACPKVPVSDEIHTDCPYLQVADCTAFANLVCFSLGCVRGSTGVLGESSPCI